MPFEMDFSKEDLKGIEPVPANVYKVRFLEFKPKKAKSGTSVNLNAWVQIEGHPEWPKPRKIVANLNDSIANFIQDFVHSFGLEMTPTPTGGKIPGSWDGERDKPETWKYSGPLVNKVAEWELGPPDEGQKYNTIRKFICKVPNCAQKNPDVQHATDMAKKS